MSSNNEKLNQQYLKWLYAIAQKDRQAFQNLYEASAGKLLAIACKLLNRQDLAEEIVQDTFIKVWHNAATYHTERGSVMTWLVSIVRNRCIDELRHQKVHHNHSNDLPLPADINPNVLETATDNDSKLYRCMDLLQGAQRQTIQLAYFYGLTHQEIMKHLEAPLGSIKSWIRRGLESLKRCVKS